MDSTTNDAIETCQQTAEQMQQTILEYFADFFEDMKFSKIPIVYPDPNIFVFEAVRKGYPKYVGGVEKVGYVIKYDFDLEKWNEDVFFRMQYHQLENIKGKCLKYEEGVYLG
ncbi:MAG: hypothetical protein ACXVAY_01485 [Mucilaginibacter sp.]